MKIRILNQNGLFVPQYQKKQYYSTSWVGFGCPIVKFKKQNQAMDFVSLIEQSEVKTPAKKKDEVIYTNFAPEGKL